MAQSNTAIDPAKVQWDQIDPAKVQWDSEASGTSANPVMRAARSFAGGVEALGSLATQVPATVIGGLAGATNLFRGADKAADISSGVLGGSERESIVTSKKHLLSNVAI